MMTKRLKRIYYIPGILTLAIAPILVTVKTSKYISDRTEHCLIIIAGRNDDENGKEYLFPKRDYLTYNLSGQEKQDSSTIILLENFSKGLQLSKNDSIGIKVVINKDVKYKTYINVLNSCLKSGISDWIPLGDTIFIFHKNNPDYYNNELCQNTLTTEMWGDDCLLPFEEKPKLSLIQKIRNEKNKIKLAFPFGILILFFGYQMIRNIKNEC